MKHVKGLGLLRLLITILATTTRKRRQPFAKSLQKYIEKLKQNVFWGFYLSKQSEKANFYGDVINARQGQKCI